MLKKALLLLLVLLFVCYPASHFALSVGDFSPLFTVSGLTQDGSFSYSLNQRDQEFILTFFSGKSENWFLQLQEIEKAAKLSKNSRLKFIPIHVDRDEKSVKIMLEKKNISIPVYQDKTGLVTRKFNIQRYPTHVFLLPTGKIHKMITGFQKESFFVPEDVKALPPIETKKPTNLILWRMNKTFQIAWQAPSDKTGLIGFDLFMTRSYGEKVKLNDEPLKSPAFAMKDTGVLWNEKVGFQVVSIYNDNTRTSSPLYEIILRNDARITLNIGSPKIQIEGEEAPLSFDEGASPLLIEERVFVPLRKIVEACNGLIEWNNAQRKVSLQLNKSIDLYMDKNYMIVNDVLKVTDFSPKIINGRTYVPLRSALENIGFSFSYTPPGTVQIFYELNKAFS